MNIESSSPLKLFNTLAIDARAEYFAQPVTMEEVAECLQFARAKRLPVKVLGGGSNVVMTDRVSGLVLKYRARECEVLHQTENEVTVKVGAGYDWHQFVLECLSRGWFGLENLAYIPGTVGAAPVQNIGAYGVEVKKNIKSVNGIFLSDGRDFCMSTQQCAFGYRESCFKGELKGKVLITSVVFTLSKIADVQIGYAPLDRLAKERGVPTPALVAEWVIEVRKSKLPSPIESPNAGSFFKNPVITREEYLNLHAKYPEMPSYEQSDGVKIPAGWLIDTLGLKGAYFGVVKVHEFQALVLVNEGGSAKDVLKAAQSIRGAVMKEFGIELEQEPSLFN
ncbi:MAG: UDP-N-acetylmuramate dehydrogenase [Bermanella sp.]